MSEVNFDEMFPDNRREGETVLRQAQLVMLRMFRIIDFLCRKHHIRYWMCSGTLLGAVRHKGFIPWDDDVDICMLREDYELFLQVAMREFPTDMMLQTRETDPNYHYLPLPCKVRDKKSFILTPAHADEKSEKGLFIDIFPADRYHTNKFVFLGEKALKIYNRFICDCLDAVYFKNESLDKKILSFFHPVFQFLVVRYMRTAKKMIDRNRTLGENCLIGHGFDTMWKRYFLYDDIFPLIEIEFEGFAFYAPHSTDVYLRALYGSNYMTPPSKERQLKNQHARVMKPVLD